MLSLPADHEYASCGHGADGDPMEPIWGCWGCLNGQSVGPHLPPKPKRKVGFEASFVEDVRRLSGDLRWPLKAVSDGGV